MVITADVRSIEIAVYIATFLSILIEFCLLIIYIRPIIQSGLRTNTIPTPANNMKANKSFDVYYYWRDNNGEYGRSKASLIDYQYPNNSNEVHRLEEKLSKDNHHPFIHVLKINSPLKSDDPVPAEDYSDILELPNLLFTEISWAIVYGISIPMFLFLLVLFVIFSMILGATFTRILMVVILSVFVSWLTYSLFSQLSKYRTILFKIAIKAAVKTGDHDIA